MKKPLSQPVHSTDGAKSVALDVIAGDALGFLAEDAERLERFFAVTGLTLAALRGAARDSGFTESLLDYLTSDERLLVAFASERGYDPAAVESARQALAPPPDDP